MKFKNIRLIICIIISAILVHSLWVYNSLDIGETPLQSDVIIVPEGGEYRSKKAVELLKLGYSTSNKILVSPMDKENGSLVNTYIAEGVDYNQIIPESSATSTYLNAVNTLKIMDNNNYSSAIIVTSDYHTRRTKLIFDRVNRKYDFDLIYVSSYYNMNDKLYSYKQLKGLRPLAYSEVLKYYGYLFNMYCFIDF